MIQSERRGDIWQDLIKSKENSLNEMWGKVQVLLVNSTPNFLRQKKIWDSTNWLSHVDLSQKIGWGWQPGTNWSWKMIRFENRAKIWQDLIKEKENSMIPMEGKHKNEIFQQQIVSKNWLAMTARQKLIMKKDLIWKQSNLTKFI